MGSTSYVTRRSDIRKPNYRSDKEGYSVQIEKNGVLLKDQFVFESVIVEETVMEWPGASHIKRWFAKNVRDNEPEYKPWTVSKEKLFELLSVCEEVLFAAQLVPGKEHGRKGESWHSLSSDSSGEPAKVMKSVDTAYKLLPLETPRGYAEGYDEEYLKAVEETRNWILRMAADERNGISGEFYYHNRW